MKNVFIVIASLLGSVIVHASDLVIAKLNRSSENRLPDPALVLLNQLELQGKLIKREKGPDTEITYFHEDSPELLKSLKNAGVITNRVSVDSQKTGGGCGGVAGMSSSRK